MKITRNQLRSLISETLQEMSYRVPDRNPGMSARERYELEYGSDDPYYISEPLEDKVPVLSPEEIEEKERREEEQRRIQRAAIARAYRILGDSEY